MRMIENPWWRRYSLIDNGAETPSRRRGVVPEGNVAFSMESIAPARTREKPARLLGMDGGHVALDGVPDLRWDDDPPDRLREHEWP